MAVTAVSTQDRSVEGAGVGCGAGDGDGAGAGDWPGGHSDGGQDGQIIVFGSLPFLSPGLLDLPFFDLRPFLSPGLLDFPFFDLRPFLSPGLLYFPFFGLLLPASLTSREIVSSSARFKSCSSSNDVRRSLVSAERSVSSSP